MAPSARSRAVFVAGLGHSGSTLLDLMLAGHSRVTGLGEVQTLLRLHGSDRDAFLATRCSCGAELARCEFWSKVAARFARTEPRSLDDGYRGVAQTFADTFGPDAVLVDSSKNLDALRSLRAANPEVSVLFLVRDVRSWTISMRDRNRDRGQQSPWQLVRRDGWAGMTRFAGQTSIAYFRFWHRRNWGMQRAICDDNVPMLRLGYEPLATSTATTMEAAAAWMDLRFEPGMLTPNPDSSHTASGNDMRLSPEKLRSVQYDARWLTRRDWMLAAALQPKVMRYNAEQVYAGPVAVSSG